MNPTDALALARLMVKQHPLSGWTVKLSKSFSFAGRCKYGPQVIELNARWVALATDDEVKNTILHEIAHALVGSRHGHDYVWYSKFIEIGGHDAGNARSNGLHETKKYIVQCVEGCENLGYRQRRDPRLINNKVCRRHNAKLVYKENALV